MLARFWIAVLLLTNYLMVLGVGCIHRPDDLRELILVQTSGPGYNYQQCRYLRMDGLENFLMESLASRYQNTPKTPKHHLVTVTNGIDTHCLPDTYYPIRTFGHEISPLPVSYKVVISDGIHPCIDLPPRLG